MFPGETKPNQAREGATIQPYHVSIAFARCARAMQANRRLRRAPGAPAAPACRRLHGGRGRVPIASVSTACLYLLWRYPILTLLLQ